MSRAGKHRTYTAPPTGYGEAGKGFFAVRFRQIASSRGVSDLSTQAKLGGITVTDSWGVSPRSTCRKIAAAAGFLFD